MYENLKSVMAQKGITIKTIADILKLHRNTVENKLNGDSEFTYIEAETISNTLFPEYRISFLFHRKIAC